MQKKTTKKTKRYINLERICIMYKDIIFHNYKTEFLVIWRKNKFKVFHSLAFETVSARGPP